jgi:hypothetical protein
MKLLVRLIPYAIVLAFAVLNSRMQRLNDALIATGARQPNDSTGQTWEIAYRGGAFRYVTLQEYVTYYAPFVMGRYSSGRLFG